MLRSAKTDFKYTTATGDSMYLERKIIDAWKHDIPQPLRVDVNFLNFGDKYGTNISIHLLDVSGKPTHWLTEYIYWDRGDYHGMRFLASLRPIDQQRITDALIAWITPLLSDTTK